MREEFTRELYACHPGRFAATGRVLLLSQNLVHASQDIVAGSQAQCARSARLRRQAQEARAA